MADLVNKDAIVRFLAGYEENLSGTPIENGTVYFALKPDPLNSSKTIGSIYVDANGKRILMSGESYAVLDALGDKIVSKYIKAIELDGSAGSKGVLTYVKGDGSDVDITMPAAGVSTAGIITTGSQTLAGQKTFNGLIIPKGGSMVHQAVGTSGTAGYVKIAQLKITGNYQDMPIVMELVDRSRTGSCVLNIRFTNTNSNDPTLDSFTYQGTNYTCYLYKSATSTWDLYVRKGESYGNPTVVRYHKASYMSKVAVTWTDVHADSVPSGATIASLGGSVSHASKADSATKATQDGSGNNINTTYLRDLDFETGTSVFKIWGIKGNSSSGTVISVPAATDKIAGLVTTGAQLFAGTKSFQDFIYSGIASDTTSNAARALWFMSGTTGKPVYSSGLTYNPSTKTLTVEKLNGLASKAISDENGKKIHSTYLANLASQISTTDFKIWGIRGDGSDSPTKISVPAANATVAGLITTGTQTLTGAKTLDVNGSLTIQKSAGFIYSAIQEATAANARAVWFSDSSQKGTPVLHSSKFTYNPSSTAKWAHETATPSAYGVLKADRFEGLAQKAVSDSAGNVILDKYIATGEISASNKHLLQLFKGNGKDVNIPLNFVALNGDTMTGQLKTSFKGAVATGSYQASATTIPDLLNEVRYSSGVVGSVNIGTNYVSPTSGETIPGGWYNFEYIPHRNGGLNGSSSGDNCNYGTLLLYGMTVNAQHWRIRYANSAIAEVRRVWNWGDTITKATADENGKNIADTYISALDIYEHTGSSFKIVGYDGNSKENSIVALPIVTDGSKSTLVTTGTQTFAGAKTFTSDITLSGTNTNIQASGRSTSWHKGRDVALIKTTSYSGYNTAYSLKTTNGDWSVGVYAQNGLYWTYILDSNYNNNVNTVTVQMTLDANGLLTAPSLKVKTNATIDATTSTKDLIVNQNALITNNLSIGGKNTNYDLYNEGTSYFKGIITLPNTAYIAQYQSATSNYTTAVKWLSGGVSAKTYDPQIGHHNTGNSSGAMILLPYATDTNPWDGSVGLYLGKGVLKLDGSPVVTQANHKTYLDGTYVNVDGDTMTGDLTVAKKDAAVKVDYGGQVMGILSSVDRGLYDFTSKKWLIYSKASASYATCIPTHLYLEDGLTVAGATTLNNSLTVAGATTLNGATTINNSLKVTGVIHTAGNKYDDAHTGALNLNNSNIFGVNAIFMCDLSDSPSEGIHFYRTSTTVDTLWIKNGVIYFAPNRTLGQNGTSYIIPRTFSTSGTVGSAAQPVYLASGTITPLSATIGSSTYGTYLNNGVISRLDYYLQANIKSYSGSLSSGGWAALNGTTSSGYGPSIAVAYNNSAAAWNSGIYSSSLVWGHQDTRGLLDCSYSAPIVTFGGSSFGGATADAPKWYIKISGTSGRTYNLDKLPDFTGYYWANIKISTSSSAATTPTFNTCYTSNWFRSTGSTGWYSETYGGGIYMNDSTYVRIYNGKMLYSSGRMLSNSLGGSWIDGQKLTNAAYNVGDATSTGGYWPWMRQTNTSNGYWFSFGTLGTRFHWIGSPTSRTDNGYTHGMTYDISDGTLRAEKVYNAVWNDYAEFRAANTEEPGRVVIEGKFGVMIRSTERLQAGASIISDTFGHAMGETDECKTPIAVAGRALAYPHEDRDSYPLGAAVCTGPDGTVSLMTREEIMMYPERIVGTVSEIPTYETWGSGNVKVNGRIWIKVK